MEKENCLLFVKGRILGSKGCKVNVLVVDGSWGWMHIEGDEDLNFAV